MTSTYNTKDIAALTEEINILLDSLENMAEDLKGIVRIDPDHVGHVQNCLNVADYLNVRMARYLPDWGNMEICRTFRSEFYRVGNLLGDYFGNLNKVLSADTLYLSITTHGQPINKSPPGHPHRRCPRVS